jgi:hypothetical protein
MIDMSKLTGAAKPINLEAVNLTNYYNFKDKFHHWIHSSAQTVAGLPKDYYLVSGLTDAFNQTYGMYGKIGVFEGEYGYHQLTKPKRVTTDLSQAGVIIVSHPFSADGMSAHDKLAIADQYNKPIFVDCAFFGACKDINFDFTPYTNIRSVCFSLSKTFGTGRHRVGLLYTTAPYPVCVYEKWHYPFVAGAEYHYGLINQSTPDSLATKYGQLQQEICNELEVVPSNTVLFGLDYTNRFDQFKRGTVNRLCISELIAERYNS